jgi:hypothetical protein
MPDEAELNIREQIARIDRAIIEGQKFAVEQRKLEAEARKLDAEARLVDRNRWQGWQVVVTTLGAGAALFAAGAAFIKILG